MASVLNIDNAHRSLCISRDKLKKKKKEAVSHLSLTSTWYYMCIINTEKGKKGFFFLSNGCVEPFFSLTTMTMRNSATPIIIIMMIIIIIMSGGNGDDYDYSDSDYYIAATATTTGKTRTLHAGGDFFLA